MDYSIKITPINLVIYPKQKYGLFLFGFSFKNSERAIGFQFYKEKLPDRKQWHLVLAFYGNYKRFLIKTILNQKLITCNECGNTVWEHNLYCQHCQDEFNEDEVTTTLRF